jgi:hypothetical protein
MFIINTIESAHEISNLDTYQYTVQSAGLYTVSIQLNEIPASGVSIVIKQNGSTMATSLAPSATQSHIELQKLLNCAASDVLQIVISSSSLSDTGPNAIKALLNIRVGQV